MWTGHKCDLAPNWGPCLIPLPSHLTLMNCITFRFLFFFYSPRFLFFTCFLFYFAMFFTSFAVREVTLHTLTIIFPNQQILNKILNVIINHFFWRMTSFPQVALFLLIAKMKQAKKLCHFRVYNNWKDEDMYPWRQKSKYLGKR